jgi:hypothetical protein
MGTMWRKEERKRGRELQNGFKTFFLSLSSSLSLSLSSSLSLSLSFFDCCNIPHETETLIDNRFHNDFPVSLSLSSLVLIPLTSTTNYPQVRARQPWR